MDAMLIPAVWITQAPATMTSPGAKGQMFEDGTYLYLCYADNQWRRITLESF